MRYSIRPENDTTHAPYPSYSTLPEAMDAARRAADLTGRAWTVVCRAHVIRMTAPRRPA